MGSGLIFNWGRLSIVNGWWSKMRPDPVSLLGGTYFAWNWATQSAVEAELPLVVVTNGAQVFAAAQVQGLDRLQYFQRKSLAATNAFHVAAIRIARRADCRLCHRDLYVKRLRLCLR